MIKGVRARVSGLKDRRSDLGWLLAYAVLPMAFLVAFVALWWMDASVLRALRLRVFDTYQTFAPREYDPEAPVRIIDIDNESLTRLGQWPWPRTLLADLVRRLGAAGAAAVAFDAVFAEPDRMSPRRIAEVLPGDAPPALREKLKGLPDNDVILARAFGKVPVVAGYSLVGEANGVRPKVKAGFLFSTKQSGAKKLSVGELQRTGGSVEAKDPKDYLPALYHGAVNNLPVLENAATGAGAFSIVPDADGINRRVPLLYRLDGEAYPSLASEALRVATGSRGFKVMATGGSGKLDMGGWGGIARVVIGPLAIPTDGEGSIVLFDTGFRSERFIPAWKIFAKGFDASVLAEKILFIGTSASGLKDLRATPLDPIAPGVEIHAQVCEQALLQKFLYRPDWADRAEFFSLLATCFALIALMPRLGAAWGALLAAAAMGLAFGGSWYSYTAKGFLFDPVTPGIVVLVVYILTSLINFLRTESEKRQVRGAFSRYLSPALVEQLAQDPKRLRLGGETRELTFMFSDIRGFTTISEQFDAAGLTQFINRYLTPMTDLVLRNKGTIDKYMGDCIMAFWNAPLEDPEHALNACRAALQMRRDLAELNLEWEADAKAEGRKFIPIRSGIGVNTGPACVGNMGSDQRFDYSVLGDDVNLASRLEGQSKNYGLDLVIGPKTKEYVKDFAALELDLIRVKGKTVPVHIYTLAGDAETAKTPEFQALAPKHAALIAAYRAQKWDETERLIAECRTAPFHLEKFYEMYLGRIAAYRAEPPAVDWDGTFTATSK